MEHKSEVPAELTCACCWDDITSSNYVEYKASESSEWLTSGYCMTCIEQLIETQWDQYVNGLANSTCKAEQRRLLNRGPPINIRDPKALPCPDDAEVFQLWYMIDNSTHSAKLKGSLEGEVLISFDASFRLFVNLLLGVTCVLFTRRGISTGKNKRRFTYLTSLMMKPKILEAKILDSKEVLSLLETLD